MKKIIVILFFFTVIFLSKNEQKTISLPQNTIRFRIIANSNGLKDQEIKAKIRNELENKLITTTNLSYDYNKTKNLIANKIETVKKVIEEYNIDYDLNFGENYFPEKKYKGLTFAAGNYESLVITLGSGLGSNWWCILFPPLCLLEAQEKNYDEITYKSFIQEQIEKVLNKTS